MGVYINMEMPINCEKCIYSAWSNFYQIYTCNAIRKNEPVIFDEKQVMSTSIVRSRRADSCPLVPVPPHGRLIDADALKKTSYPFPCAIGVEYAVTLRSIDDAPTIIPAEEVDDG